MVPLVPYLNYFNMRCRKWQRVDVALALPFSNYKTIPTELLSGKIVVDINNYYPERDGQIIELDEGRITTSEMIAQHLPGSRVVKAFNSIMANDLQNDGRPPGTPGRRALPMAGDDPAAKAIVAKLVDEAGFDPVDVGPLSEGWRFERARPVYCVPFDKVGLTSALAQSSRDNFEAEYSWRAQKKS